MKDFYKITNSKKYKDWEKEQRKKDEARLHVDLSTREGMIVSIMDLFDQLGFCVQTNAQRDENGLIVYDENGEPLLLEGETEAKLLERANLTEMFKGFGKGERAHEKKF